MKPISCVMLAILLCAVQSYALAQSSAKELFIGLDGSSTQLASAASSPGPAKPRKPRVLGLQTTIYELFNDGGVKAVSPSTIFRGGSRIRLGFNANKPGFLYVVNIGTSGKVTTIFPGSPTDNNQVQPGLVYQIPQQTGKSIRFDTTPGVEVMLVVLAESRIAEFEYGGQTITLTTPPSASMQSAQASSEQRIQLASIDEASTSKDLFVEDDGVFQTVVFKPESQPATHLRPLISTIKLIHR